ncbi:IFN protein, partial [Brachypteracias leptosomus]|nr:IFN protein [Brachypteracias leptosomus]
THSPTMPAHATPHTRRARTLLLLLTALASALACQHLRTHDAIADTIQLLRDMAPTQPCHHQEVTFRFPDNLLTNTHPQQAAVTAFHILRHLFSILSSSSIPQQWQTQAQHQLLSNLHHYIHHLEQCLPANGPLFQRRGPHNMLLSINKYFADIQHFLLAHNHSVCAWDHIRLQARACLQRVDTLMRQMK